jgi:dCTP deaminase
LTISGKAGRQIRGDKMPPSSTKKPPSPTNGGFWSRQRILEGQRSGGLFWLPGPAPSHARQRYIFDKERLRAASYTLLMGSEAYVTPVGESDSKSVRTLGDGEAFMIPPGQFAFLLTHEAVRVPDDAIALLALRAQALKFQGLVNVSGFHIDPGYNGRLVLAVHNAGPGQVHLRQGQPLFEVFFADLDRPTDRPYQASVGTGAIFHIEPRFISPIAGEFETLKGLKNKIEDVEAELEERIHSLEREQSVTRWASALILGAVIAFGVRECAVGAAPPSPPPAGSATNE